MKLSNFREELGSFDEKMSNFHEEEVNLEFSWGDLGFFKDFFSLAQYSLKFEYLKGRKFKANYDQTILGQKFAFFSGLKINFDNLRNLNQPNFTLFSLIMQKNLNIPQNNWNSKENRSRNSL